MENNFYGRDESENNREVNQNEGQDNIYSYSYVNPKPGQENPNETTGYQPGNGTNSSYHNGNQQNGYYQNNANGNGYYQNGGYQNSYNQYNESYHTAGQGATTYTQAKAPRRKLTGFPKTLAKTVAVALVFGLVSSATFAGVVKYMGVDMSGISSVVSYKAPKIENTAEGMSTGSGISGIVDSVMPSIVAITNTAEAEVQSFFGQQTQQYESAGSGIIIAQDDKYIYMVTNNHVVDGTIDLKVTFSDNETVAASVKGTDSATDLAVVMVKLSDMKESTRKTIKVAVMGDSKQCKVGDSVIAIGNALGYGQSVTTGVVSALERSVTVENTSNVLMQTDAAINPGNSGGALLNDKGEVIGINSAKYSDTEVEGMGYAIPISNAQPIVEAIISRNAVAEEERGYLGIYGSDLTKDIASVYNMPIGIYVSELVEGGAAQKAGLKHGDVITAIGEFEVSTLAELQSQLQYYRAGDKVEIKAQVLDNGTYVEKVFKVTLEKNRG